ncbi:MAG: STAS domain-containing protein [Anaeromyxobacteraceae bacterium]|nr:STAS domain-containing protein [Anaeromyxobacteraceae bacterium]
MDPSHGGGSRPDPATPRGPAEGEAAADLRAGAGRHRVQVEGRPEVDHPTLTVAFEGEFVLETATRAEEALRGAVEGARVSLDFARCSRVDPAGLARLAMAVKRGGGEARLVGLSRRDRRILQYLLGFPADLQASDVDVG